MKATTPTPSTGRSKQGKAGTQKHGGSSKPPTQRDDPASAAGPTANKVLSRGLRRQRAHATCCQTGPVRAAAAALWLSLPSRRRRQPPPGHHLHHYGRPIPPTLHLLHGFHACPVLSPASPTGTRHAGQFVPSRDPASPSPSIVCMAHESVNPPGRMLQDQGTSMLALERTMPGHKTARGHQAWRAARHPTRRRHAVRLGCSL